MTTPKPDETKALIAKLRDYRIREQPHRFFLDVADALERDPNDLNARFLMTLLRDAFTLLTAAAPSPIADDALWNDKKLNWLIAYSPLAAAASSREAKP